MTSHLNNLNGSPEEVRLAGEKIAELILAGPKPTPAQIRQAILDAGLTFSNAAVELRVDQCTDTVFAISLPSKAQLEATRAKIEADEQYLLPSLFVDHVENPPTSKDDHLKFYDFRLGDYVLQHCD